MSASGSLWSCPVQRPYFYCVEGIPTKSVEKVWDALLKFFGHRTRGLMAPVKFLAEKCGVAARTVTRALNRLEELGFIRRDWCPMGTAFGYLGSQTIEILIGPIPRPGFRPKARPAKDLGSKKFAPTRDNNVTSPVTGVSPLSSFEENHNEESKGAGGGEPVSAGPPPAVDGPLTAEAIRAAIARGLAESRAADPEPARPVRPGITLAAMLKPPPPDYEAKLREMAAAGDPAARAELAAREPASAGPSGPGPPEKGG